MHHLIALLISLIVILLILLLPFPGLLVSEQNKMSPPKIAVKNFNIMKYTFLTKPSDIDNTIKRDLFYDKVIEPEPANELEIIKKAGTTGSQIKKEKKVPENPLDEEKQELKINVEEDLKNTSTSSNKETEKEVQQSSGSSNKIDYIPDFTINKIPVYPAAAKRRRQEGCVKLKISTAGNGKILNIDIAESSGFILLDNAAVDAVGKWDFSRIIRHNGLNYIKTEIEFKLRKK